MILECNNSMRRKQKKMILYKTKPQIDDYYEKIRQGEAGKSVS
jgi:hypothetical protein